MAVSSDIVGQDVLTTSAATIRTGAGTENHVITFFNYSGSDVTLHIWLNGNADQNKQAEILMSTKETVVFRCKLGNTDTIQAKASAGTSIAWTDEMDALA